MGKPTHLGGAPAPCTRCTPLPTPLIRHVRHRTAV